MDLSALTGESQPALRTAMPPAGRSRLIDAGDIVFSGTACLSGEARAFVFATGMHTEIGRIAALSQRHGPGDSPLERQVRRVAWLIALVATAAGVLFFPVGVFVAGMPISQAFAFAIGLLVANVPEGLLPTITLSLAMGVRALARSGAVVKRLSAVETLGSTSVICTDKTGTLTENRMRVNGSWAAGAELAVTVNDHDRAWPVVVGLAQAVALCNNAELATVPQGQDQGDPTEIALLHWAATMGVDVAPGQRAERRHRLYHFDPALRLMSTVDEDDSGIVWLHTKGAPEQVLARSTTIVERDGHDRPLDESPRSAIVGTIDDLAGQGHRLLAVARRRVDRPGDDRAAVERDLCFIGIVTLIDPPRPEVAAAVHMCHTAGVRIVMVTGDHARTARAIAQQVGIADASSPVVGGDELDTMPEPALDDLLARSNELVFARTSPEAKLRIAEAARATGNVVAMTGDGVNDAPALRRADIGVAMGRDGTDVAREAATVVLTDDNFATIVAAVQAGRQVYDNVRKFIVDIFAHAMPEVVPFLVFALSGGAVPLPLTVMQILAISAPTRSPRWRWGVNLPSRTSCNAGRGGVTQWSSMDRCSCELGESSA